MNELKASLKAHYQVWDNSCQLKVLLKWWKMLFISPKKLFLFLRYLSFCLDFLFMYQNSLIKKIRLTSNFLTSQPREQTIVIYILPNISRSKGNQTMKFGQLIEYNMRNIFLEKSYSECDGETSPKLFWKIKIEHISGSIV